MPESPATSWLNRQLRASRLILQGTADARAAARAVWGVDFSEQPCRAVTQVDRSTLWLGPDEYLLWDQSPEAAANSAATIDALEQALAGVPHALVDVSHRQVTFEISGPHAATILSGACPLDLDIAEFPVQMCTRTVLAKAEILLWRTAPERFRIDVWRSFVPYVTGLIEEIGSEFSA